jgi:hypothetical protein
METGMYVQPSTRLTPALVIYLIDASASMNDPCGPGMPVTRMAMVNMALREGVKGMVLRSMRDNRVQPRYHIAMFAYSTTVLDLLDGIRDLPDLMRVGGPPELQAGGSATDTAAGFARVEKLLQQHLATYKSCPAPLICHLTDALRTTEDPSPVVQRIKAMSVDDGAVLIENVLMAEKVMRKQVKDWQKWGGISKAGQLTDAYARLLFGLSSPLPETYRQTMNRAAGYQLQKDARLFFPGTQSELMKLAVAASSATQV